MIIRVQLNLIISSFPQWFGDWGDLVGDAVIATAILDRLLHQPAGIWLHLENDPGNATWW